MTTAIKHNPLKCPKCSRTFAKATGLGSHMRSVHKVAGSAPSTLSYNRKRVKGHGPSFFAAKFKCPQCPQTFKRKTGLGFHLRAVHGVVGTSKTALDYHRKKHGETSQAVMPIQKMLPTLEEAIEPIVSEEETIMPARAIDLTSDSPYKCPECGQDNFISAAHLGRHRRYSHGIIGRFTKENIKAAGVEVEQKVGKKRGRPRKDENQSTQLQPAERAIPHYEQRHDSNNEANSFDPLAYALTIGSLKEFCRRAAEEHGIPTKEFTRQCAELFLREARR